MQDLTKYCPVKASKTRIPLAELVDGLCPNILPFDKLRVNGIIRTVLRLDPGTYAALAVGRLTVTTNLGIRDLGYLGVHGDVPNLLLSDGTARHSNLG